MFNNFINAKVSLIKQNGEEYNEVPACVQKKTIFIEDTSLPIEEGDYIIRQLPNGLVENYLVLDRGFCEKFGGINAHYQVKVQKETTRRLEGRSTQNYNISGTNNRINVNSNDYSVNLISSQDKELFESIRKVIQTQIHDEILIKKVDDMEASVGKSTFKDNYNKFIIGASNHMTLIAPFIPALTDMLTKSI